MAALVIVLAIAVVTLFYLYLRRKFSYWSDRGISGPTPLPFLGTQWQKLVYGQLSTEAEWTRKYGEVYGVYTNAGQPSIVTTDPELIKQVTIKDFHLFMNRAPMVAPSGALIHKMLFFSESETWKRVRAICSPAFSSGKLRSMKALMNVSVNKLASYFDKLSSEPEGKIEVKKVIYGFTIDVIASSAFGTETNANDDRDKENPFIENGIALFKRPSILRILMILTFPKFIRTFIVWLRSKNDSPFLFFENMAKEVVKQRRETGTRRIDFVQILMESFVSESDLKESNYDKLTFNEDNEDATQLISEPKTTSTVSNKFLTDREIIAQCVIFFIAGFETTATTITHCIFELATNPDIQERLYKDLQNSLEGLESTSDEYYTKVMGEMPYLEAVIKETLRKYPPLLQIDRRCMADKYKLTDNVELTKNQLVHCSIYGVHHNAKYYAEPEKFNPDRFMPENKHLLVPYTYLPFGNGPRNCIGMRFAQQEIKLCLAQVVRQFRFVSTPETPSALQFANFGLVSALPYTLKVEKR